MRPNLAPGSNLSVNLDKVKERHVWTVNPNRNSLKQTLAQVQQLLNKTFLKEDAAVIYTVITELTRNGLEHGCFAIGQELKSKLQDDEQFQHYLEDCELKYAGTPDLKLTLTFTDALTVEVVDPGLGFNLADLANFETNYSVINPTKLNGRGIQLVKKLSSALLVEKCPSAVKATFNFD